MAPGKLSASSGRRLAQAGIALALVLFAAVNLLAGATAQRFRLDLTAEGRFTLSPASADLLATLDEPLTLRLYLSRLLTDLNPAYAAHAARVRDLLEAFERRAEGRLRLEVFDPAPFSAEEDLAVADGVQGLSLNGAGGDLVYFGLAGRNSTDDRETIGFFSLERAAYLEYDLARLVATLARPEKARIGSLGAAALSGDQASGFVPQTVYTLMQQLVEVVPLDASGGQVPADLDVVLLAQPERLSPAELYALDQFVLRGGRLLVFADPFSERQAAIAQQQYLPPSPADLSGVAPLFAAWGFVLEPGVIAADRLSARRVVAASQGRQVVTDYIAWLGLGPERFAAGEPLLQELSLLHLNSAGVLTPLPDATTRFQPLVSTSDEGTRLAVEQVAMAPDPVALLAGYQSLGPQVLAARVGGPVASAFPDGPPPVLAEVEGLDLEALRAAHLAAATQDVEILVVADSDLLFDEAWLRTDASGSGQLVPLANNGDLVLNVLDQMTGTFGLQALRGRGLIDRPFTVIAALQQDAELRYRQREQALLERIQQAEGQIGELEQSAEGGLLLTPEQEAAIEALRLELLQARRELRQVQRGLRDDLESLVTRLQLANIAGVPLLVALAGIAVALLRRRRAQASAALRE